MKPEEITAIKALADAATEGLWEVKEPRGNRVGIYAQETLIAVVGDALYRQDAAFIAAAREAVPALIKHIDEQETIIARLSSIPR